MDTTNLGIIAFIIVLLTILIVVLVLVPAPSVSPNPNPPAPNPMCNSGSAQAITSFINSLPTSSRTAFCNAIQKGIPTSCSSWQMTMMDSLAKHNVIFSWTSGKFYPINMLQNQCSLTGSSTMTFSITDDSGRTSTVKLTVS